jgi:hypothetical protein
VVRIYSIDNCIVDSVFVSTDIEFCALFFVCLFAFSATPLILTPRQYSTQDNTTQCHLVDVDVDVAAGVDEDEGVDVDVDEDGDEDVGQRVLHLQLMAGGEYDFSR